MDEFAMRQFLLLRCPPVLSLTKHRLPPPKIGLQWTAVLYCMSTSNNISTLNGKCVRRCTVPPPVSRARSHGVDIPIASRRRGLLYIHTILLLARLL